MFKFPKDYVEPFSDKIVRRGRAIFDFYGAAAGDLPFKKDDIIIIREATKSEGWVRGSLDGKQGNVPVNYIREIPMPTTHQVQYENITHVKCLLDNHATSIEELILHKGDVIKLLGPVMDGRCREVIVGGKFKDHLFDPKYNDWWMGSLDYRVGVFSMSFVETINDHRFDAFSLPPRDISRRLRVSIISVGTFKTDTWSGSTLHHPRCEFIMDSRVEFKSNALVSMVGDQFREHFSPSCEESWECDLRERLLFVVQLFARVESPTYSGATEEFYGSVQVQYSASDNTEQRYYFPKGAWVVLRFTTADDSTLSSFQSLESLDPLTISPVKWSKNLSRVPSKSKGLRSRLADMLVKAEDVT